MVRSTDTDVVVILLRLCGRSKEMNIIIQSYVDYGAGNHRRYTHVSSIADALEKKQPWMAEAIIGLHALTCLDIVKYYVN